ncbi:MAG: acyl-ACP--UDP-N-acetylglucosamine O-acyltransferase [Bacteroidota bacterium]|nr:acyl-ACP--UDP-N-acetylglucosamine O-acyltransferase [Bacteroidota bacterium]
MAHIHPTAIVSPKARIAEDATIGPFAIVRDDVDIGPGSSIGPHCLIDDGARIGSNVVIHQGTVVSTPPQDLKYRGEKTELFIGDGTMVREYCTLNRGTSHSLKSVIGKNCFLMAYAHVAHDCMLGDHVIIANAVQMGGHTLIGEYAIVGGSTAIHQFTHIGMHAMIAGGIRIVKDVPPYCLAGNVPARFEGLNSVGLRRRGFPRETIEALHATYRAIYYSGMNVSQGVEYVRRNIPLIPEVQNVLDFIAQSTRGIIKAA